MAHSPSALAKVTNSWGQSTYCQGRQPGLCACWLPQPQEFLELTLVHTSQAPTPTGAGLPPTLPPSFSPSDATFKPEAAALAKRASPTIFHNLIAALCL